VIPRAPFAAERYLIDLRDRTASAPEGSARELAYLWACAALDVRADCLLIPVLVTADDLPLVESLDRQNAERDWRLPPNYFRDRLDYGGCLLIIDESAGPAAGAYPNCKAVTPDP
jgi:hypothetical protein